MTFNNKSSNSATGDSPLAVKLTKNPRYYIYLVFFLVVLSAQGSFVNDMYTPALPEMHRFFGCSVSLSQMGITMGMIGLAVGQICLGPLSDKYGRKPTLIGSTMLFIVSAVASIFATSIHIFNLCRLFQGLGASAGYFLAKTIPADVYAGRPLAKIMAIVGAINGIAPAASPVIGGVLADDFGWKSIFIVLASFAGLVILFSCYMKESLAPSQRSTGSVFASFRNYVLLLRNKRFMIHVMLKGVALGLLFAYISSAPFILQDHYGLSETAYGIYIGVNSVFVATGSILSLKFHPYKKAAFVGSIMATAAVIALAFSLYLINNLWVYEACTVVLLLALGMIFSTTNTLAMNEGRAHSGEASAIVGVAGYVVGATVAPLSGLGNVLHSTAITDIVLAAIMMLFAYFTYRLPVDNLE